MPSRAGESLKIRMSETYLLSWTFLEQGYSRAQAMTVIVVTHRDQMKGGQDGQAGHCLYMYAGRYMSKIAETDNQRCMHAGLWHLVDGRAAYGW
eukprot:scaffold571177_cov18-Prasinocladus_malaysianus.AAC.2